MSITLRILIFGVVSGLLWALVPGTLSDLFHHSAGETATVFVSGALAGLLVSFAQRTFLAKSSIDGAFVIGIVSLPLAAFAFGVLVSLVQWGAREFTGVTYHFVADGSNPFLIGFQYAIFSVFSVFVIFLGPLSIYTTLLLRAVIRFERKHVP